MIAPDLHADITPPNPPGAVPFPCNSWAQGSATSETACDCTVKTEEGPGPHTLQGRIDFDAMGTAKGEFTFLTLRAVCAGSTLTAKYNDFADKWTITGSIKVGAGAPVVINETITGLSLSYSKLFFQPFPNGAAYINTYATYGGQVRAVDGVSM